MLGVGAGYEGADGLRWWEGCMGFGERVLWERTGTGMAAGRLNIAESGFGSFGESISVSSPDDKGEGGNVVFVGEEEVDDKDDWEPDIRREGEVYESILVVDTRATGAEMLFLIDFRFDELELPTLGCEFFFVRVRRNDIVSFGEIWRFGDSLEEGYLNPRTNVSRTRTSLAKPGFSVSRQVNVDTSAAK